MSLAFATMLVMSMAADACDSLKGSTGGGLELLVLIRSGADLVLPTCAIASLFMADAICLSCSLRCAHLQQVSE